MDCHIHIELRQRVRTRLVTSGFRVQQLTAGASNQSKSWNGTSIHHIREVRVVGLSSVDCEPPGLTGLRGLCSGGYLDG